jgi:hypothetical protein
MILVGKNRMVFQIGNQKMENSLKWMPKGSDQKEKNEK